MRLRFAVVLGIVVVGGSACSVVADFAGYVGGGGADAAPSEAGLGVDATVDASEAPQSGSDAGAEAAVDARAEAATDGSVGICRPGLTGPACADSCPKNTAGRACDFKLVYGLVVPAGGTWPTVASVPYSDDNASTFAAFTRVAYRLVLDQDDLWVEADAFTTDATQLGVPIDNVVDLALTDVLVYSFSSNQKSVLTKTDGHIQLWSNCYKPDDGGVFDGLDNVDSTQPHCYGTIEVTVAGDPVLSFHRWANQSANNVFDIGIGAAADQKHPDWTFAQNAGSFTTRRLEVYAR